MNWNEALAEMDLMKYVTRKSWLENKRIEYITIVPGMNYILGFKPVMGVGKAANVQAWMPFKEDFEAQDWMIVDNRQDIEKLLVEPTLQ